jgi:hypothetical protein
MHDDDDVPEHQSNEVEEEKQQRPKSDRMEDIVDGFRYGERQPSSRRSPAIDVTGLDSEQKYGTIENYKGDRSTSSARHSADDHDKQQKSRVNINSAPLSNRQQHHSPQRHDSDDEQNDRPTNAHAKESHRPHARGVIDGNLSDSLEEKIHQMVEDRLIALSKSGAGGTNIHVDGNGTVTQAPTIPNNVFVPSFMRKSKAVKASNGINQHQLPLSNHTASRQHPLSHKLSPVDTMRPDDDNKASDTSRLDELLQWLAKPQNQVDNNGNGNGNHGSYGRSLNGNGNGNGNGSANVVVHAGSGLPLTPYKGKQGDYGDEIASWLEEYEIYTFQKGWTEAEMIYSLAFYLKDTIAKRFYNDNRTKYRKWSEAKAAIIEFFRPDSQLVTNALMNLQSEDYQTADELYRRTAHIAQHLPVGGRDLTASFYVQALHPAIRSLVMTRLAGSTYTLAEARKIACVIEETFAQGSGASTTKLKKGYKNPFVKTAKRKEVVESDSQDEEGDDESDPNTENEEDDGRLHGKGKDTEASRKKKKIQRSLRQQFPSLDQRPKSKVLPSPKVRNTTITKSDGATSLPQTTPQTPENERPWYLWNGVKQWLNTNPKTRAKGGVKWCDRHFWCGHTTANCLPVEEYIAKRNQENYQKRNGGQQKNVRWSDGKDTDSNDQQNASSSSSSQQRKN